MTRPVKRSFTLDGHRTSISLEAPFWAALQEVAKLESLSLAALVQRIDRDRGSDGSNGHDPSSSSLSGAIRIYLLAYFRARAVETGTGETGQGSRCG